MFLFSVKTRKIKRQIVANKNGAYKYRREIKFARKKYLKTRTVLLICRISNSFPVFAKRTLSPYFPSSSAPQRQELIVRAAQAKSFQGKFILDNDEEHYCWEWHCFFNIRPYCPHKTEVPAGKHYNTRLEVLQCFP